MDEHREPVGVGQTEGGSAGEKRGLRRVVDHVEDGGDIGQRVEIDGNLVGGAEAGAGGVDQERA